MRRSMSSAVVLTLVAGMGLAWGQSTGAAQNKLLAKRAAEADAYRKLAEAVYGLEINSRTFVKDFVTESDEIRAEVDTFVKGVRLGEPYWYEDGVCEIRAEVTVAKVVEVLKEAHKRHYRGNTVKAEDFTHITRRTEKQIIEAIGMGAPRPDLPPDLPAGVAEQLTDESTPAPTRAPVPMIWRSVSPQARLMATQAARADASRKLAERIIGLRLTSNTQVRDFVAESDVIRTEVQGRVYPQDVRTFYHADDLIVEVTQRVSTEQVIKTIKELHSRHYKGDDVKGHDIEQAVTRVIKRDFEATGMGVPAQPLIRQATEKTGVYVPDWSTETIEVVGEATDPAIDTAQGRLMAARAAEVVAKRNLAERIAGLTLQSETTVRDFITEHDEISAQVNAVIVGATVVETSFTEESAIVKVQLSGMRVWDMLRVRVRYSGP